MSFSGLPLKEVIIRHQEAASMTAKEISTGFAYIGIITEVGELADLYKHEHYHAKDAPRERYVEEGGDVLYYLMVLQLSLLDGGGVLDVTEEDLSRTHLWSKGGAFLRLGKVIEAAYQCKPRSAYLRLAEVLASIGVGVVECHEHNVQKVLSRHPRGYTDEGQRRETRQEKS